MMRFFSILVKLPIQDLMRMCQVNRRIANLCRDPFLWKERLRYFFPDYPILSSAKIKDYRQCYIYMTKFYKPETDRAEQIEIPTSLFSVESEDNLPSEDEIVERLNQDVKIQRYLEEANVRRGDIVHLEVYGDYRNDGKFIYDGENLVPLNTEIDEYGSIPNEFRVIDEFPIRYWENVIEHNSIVPFDPIKYIDDIRNNLKRIECQGKCFKTTFYDPCGREYTLFIINEMEEPLNKYNLERYLRRGIYEWEDIEEFNRPDILSSYDENRRLFIRLPGYSREEEEEEEEEEEKEMYKYRTSLPVIRRV